jgi:nucleoside-diphosphate-sugar epimerase
MPEKYLITGSHGFLGSELKRYLKTSNQKIIEGERNGYLPPDIDYVIACQSYGNMYGQNDSEKIWFANVTALENILRESDRLKKIIYCSSTSVSLSQQTQYSKAKNEGEILCAKNNKAIVIRPASITGVGEQKEHLIPKLIDSCINGTEMPFVGEPTHDFIDVKDVVLAITRLLSISTKQCDIFNVSSGKTTSNEEVLRMVEEYTGKKANIKRVESLRNYDTKNWVVDNSKLLQTGWNPIYPLQDSIKRMINEKVNLQYGY